MKTIILLLLSITASAQCNTSRIAQAYYGLPSFFGLYFSNQCISGQIRDTTICVKVAKTNQTQVSAFSYSSPSGQPAFVTSVKQYNAQCVYIGNGTMIPAGTDTITICYTIQAVLIDNFCPYTVLAGGLAVDWCGIYSYYSDGDVRVRWITCSNSGTHKFEVITSTDAVNWRTIRDVAPIQETNSKQSEYNIAIPFDNGGINYFAVREIDVNGKAHVSDVVFCEVPYTEKKQSGYDILGRSVSSSKYMYYVSPR